MTAEIAVMNKQAIALAADSAVTQGQKIFPSANKIFMLSKYHPVGVMIYDNAEFMGIPWETIIKIYRSKLGRTEFNTLKEYASDFIDFLRNENQLFPESEQERFLKSSVRAYFRHIRENIKHVVQESIIEEDEITGQEIKSVTNQTINHHYEIWQNATLLPLIPDNYIRDLEDKYKTFFAEAIKQVFENLPITQTLSRKLMKIATNLFVKFPEGVSHTAISGIVIAGFGREDVFPVLQSFLFEGRIGSYLKYKEDRTEEITFQISASITPFAQSEMVYTFMEGVDPNYQAAIERDLSQIFDQYPQLIAENIEKLNTDEKNQLKEHLKAISNKMLNAYIEKLENYRQQNYVDRVVNIVDMLPKDELAAMAESLINLTSFKRRVSMDAETVGGPIDVAVISKGDGFIWIKRKHYFSPEFNPRFFTNYYRSYENEEETQKYEGDI